MGKLSAQLGARGHCSEIVELEGLVDEGNSGNGGRWSRLGWHILGGFRRCETRDAENQAQADCGESHSHSYAVPFR
jgi:hypothetical protein